MVLQPCMCFNLSRLEGVAMAYKRHKSETQLPETREKINQAWELHIKGFNQLEIAIEIGVAQQTVSKYIRQTERIYIAHFANKIDRVKKEHIARLMCLYRDCIDSWIKSKAVGPYGEHLNNQFGDIKYLNTAIECLAQIRQIMGANAPVKFHFKGINVKELSAEQLQAITEITDPSEISSLNIEGFEGL